jgi:hypothetical protein
LPERGGARGNGKLLIVLACSHVYIANLQTGTMQEVMSYEECLSVVRLEIDWRSTFFMAHLACTNKENNDKAAADI